MNLLACLQSLIVLSRKCRWGQGLFFYLWYFLSLCLLPIVSCLFILVEVSFLAVYLNKKKLDCWWDYFQWKLQLWLPDCWKHDWCLYTSLTILLSSFDLIHVIFNIHSLKQFFLLLLSSISNSNQVIKQNLEKGVQLEYLRTSSHQKKNKRR